MTDLLPFLRLIVSMLSLAGLLWHWSLVAGMGLLSLSGWFLPAAVAGMAVASREPQRMTPAGGGSFFLSPHRRCWGERW